MYGRLKFFCPVDDEDERDAKHLHLLGTSSRRSFFGLNFIHFFLVTGEISWAVGHAFVIE